MAFVGSMLGFGDSGANYNGKSTNILQPTDTAQVGNAYNAANSGLTQQQNFLNSLGAQNGLANQSNVFSQQQALANQMQGVANGIGPNPALQQLQNTTGQNIAAQNALMAGQRGSSANAGLLARQAAMQGAATQQQAVGQGAALQAQQQLAGMQALQQQQAQMANVSTNQVNQQANALHDYNQAAQSEQQNLLGALNNYNSSNVAMQSNINSSNAGVASTVAQGQQALMGGLMAGAGAGAVMLAAAHGGKVPAHFDAGGPVNSQGGPSSNVGRYLFKSAPSQNQASMLPASNSSFPANAGANSLEQGTEAASIGLGTLLATQMKSGGPINGEALRTQVPGQAKVKGDSFKNDIVPAMLSPGEVVIPRHVMQSSDPVQGAAKFVASVLKKKGRSK